MRIISGDLKGIRLKTLKGRDVRPTLSRVRESIFDIIYDFQGKDILDLFAGTGSLGIEALSRGARRAVFVEKDPLSISIIKENLGICGLIYSAKVIRASFERGIKLLERRGDKFHIIFLDPPYNKGYISKTLTLLHLYDIFYKDAIIIVEHTKKEGVNNTYPNIKFIESRRYGDSLISIFKGDSVNEKDSCVSRVI
jgi:16S rRNA (guanine(966)-N(2))-methyltransferase RsmD